MGHYLRACSNALYDFAPDKGLQFHSTTLEHVGIVTVLLGLVNIAAYVIFKSSVLLKREVNYTQDDKLSIVSPSLT